MRIHGDIPASVGMRAAIASVVAVVVGLVFLGELVRLGAALAQAELRVGAELGQDQRAVGGQAPFEPRQVGGAGRGRTSRCRC